MKLIIFVIIVMGISLERLWYEKFLVGFYTLNVNSTILFTSAILVKSSRVSWLVLCVVFLSPCIIQNCTLFWREYSSNAQIITFCSDFCCWFPLESLWLSFTKCNPIMFRRRLFLSCYCFQLLVFCGKFDYLLVIKF